MPESRAYTLQNRDKSLAAQKKKGADDSPPREYFRTMADSKIKHSHSLTSLSSRFLHGASSSSTSGQQTNGSHHAHNSLSNGHHGTVGNGNNSMMLNGKDGVELDGSDDYGFLSYNTSRVERDNASKLSGPTSAKSLTRSLHNNSNFSLGSSNHNGNGGGVVGSGSFYSTATYGRLKHSSQQQQQQQLHHPQCQHHNSNNGGVGGGRQSKLRNGSVAPICACDCHLTMGNASNNGSGVGSSSVVSSGNGINGTNTIGSRTSSNSSSGSSGGSGSGGGGGGVGSNGSSSTATTSSSSSSSNGSNKINAFTSLLTLGLLLQLQILKMWTFVLW